MKTEQEVKEEYHRVYKEIHEKPKSNNYQRAKLISKYETLHWILFDNKVDDIK